MSLSCKCNAERAASSSSGSTPKPSRLYEVGDEITLTVRVIEAAPPKGVCVEIVGAKRPWHRYLTSAELDAGTLAPRPVKVGDRVTWGGWADYEVLAIHGEEACLANGRFFDGVLRRGMCVAPVTSLTKVSP